MAFLPTSVDARYRKPQGLLAGFHVAQPEAQVPELVHAGEQWAQSNFSIPDHEHEVWEFYLQISGETHWKALDQTYVLRPSGLFVAAPKVRHHLSERPVSKHHFLFAAIDLNVVFARHPSLEATWRERQVVFFPQGENLTTPFRQLIRELSLTLPERAIGVRLALDYLVVEASRLFATSAVKSLAGLHPAVAQAKEMLEHQPHRDWKLSDLARLTGISAGHLAELFRRDTGISPRQYLLQTRIAYARELLTSSDISITQLALELGFCSSQHFAAVFKRFTKKTPQEFRNCAFERE